MGDALAMSFLSRLISDLETEQDKKTGNIKKALKTISRFAKTAGVIAADTFVGGKAADTLESGFAALSEQNEADMPQAMGLRLVSLHTSGHADPDTIRSLIERVQPTEIIPIHTENAGWFESLQ